MALRSANFVFLLIISIALVSCQTYAETKQVGIKKTDVEITSSPHSIATQASNYLLTVLESPILTVLVVIVAYYVIMEILAIIGYILFGLTAFSAAMALYYQLVGGDESDDSTFDYLSDFFHKFIADIDLFELFV